MEPQIIEIKPNGAIFFDEYPMSKVFAEVLVCNRSNEKIVFRIKCPKSPSEYIIIPTFSTLNLDETRKIKILMKSNKNFLELRLKDEFQIEALHYQNEGLNFSFSNATDFWKVKESQSVQIQKITLPVAFRQYDKLRNLINTIYPSGYVRRSPKADENPMKIMEEIQRSEEKMDDFSKKRTNNGFSFSKSAKNKPEIFIDETLNPYQRVTNERSEKPTSKSPKALELQEIREKIKHFSDIISEKDKSLEKTSLDPDSPIRKALYIETQNLTPVNNHPQKYRRLTSDFGGNLEDEIGFEVLSQKKNDVSIEREVTPKNESHVSTSPSKKITSSEYIAEQLEGRSAIGKKQESALLANEMPKLKNEKKSEKNVSFKDSEPGHSTEKSEKLRKPPALLKSTSIMKYEYPTLLNEISETFIKEIEDKSPPNMIKEINNLKKKMEENKGRIVSEQKIIEEKESELKKKKFLEEFFRDAHNEQSFSFFSRKISVSKTIFMCILCFVIGTFYGSNIDFYSLMVYLFSIVKAF